MVYLKKNLLFQDPEPEVEMKRTTLKKFEKIVCVTLVCVTVTGTILTFPALASAAEKSGTLVLKMNSTQNRLISKFILSDILRCFLLKEGSSIAGTIIPFKDKSFQFMIQSGSTLIKSLRIYPLVKPVVFPNLLLQRGVQNTNVTKLVLLVGGSMALLEKKNILLASNSEKTWPDLLLQAPKRCLTYIKQNPKKVIGYVLKTIVIVISVLCLEIYIVSLEVSKYNLSYQNYNLFHQLDLMMFRTKQLEGKLERMTLLYKTTQEKYISTRNQLRELELLNRLCQESAVNALRAVNECSAKDILSQVRIAQLTKQVFSLAKKVNSFLRQSKEVVVFSKPRI